MARLERGLERIAGADVLEMVAVGEMIPVAQEVSPPEVGRIQRELAGDHVHVRLAGEHHLGLAGRAGVTARDVVAVDAERLDQQVRDPVDAGPHPGAAEIHARRRLERGVGAAVEERLHATGDDPPVLAHAGAHRDDGGMARVAGHQLLRVPHEHLDRAPGHAPGGRRAADPSASPCPEVAADRRQVHADLLGRQAQRVGQELLEAERHLVRRPHLDPVLLVDRHDPRVRLEIALVVELRAEGVLEDPVGLPEPGLHVAELEAQHGLDVRVGPLG